MMNASIEWDMEAENVVLLHLSDDWHWEELYEVNKEIASIIRASDQDNYVVVDYVNTQTVPTGGFITHMRNMIGIYPENSALMIFVTQNMLVQRLLAIFQTTFQADLGKKIRIVSSFDDAYRMIDRHRIKRANVPE